MVQSSLFTGHKTQHQCGGACAKDSIDDRLLRIDQPKMAQMFITYNLRRDNPHNNQNVYAVQAFEQCCTEIETLEIAQNLKQ